MFCLAELVGAQTLGRSGRATLAELARTREDARVVDDAGGMRAIAQECVNLVTSELDVDPDWTMASVDRLDDVCRRLRNQFDFPNDRRELWWKLVDSYAGEVIVSTYGGV